MNDFAQKVSLYLKSITVNFKSPEVFDFYTANEHLYKIATNDKYNLKKKHNVTYGQLRNLAGGCPVKEFTRADFVGYSVNEDVFKINCQYRSRTKIIASFERTIDFKYKEIINDKMIIKDSNKGICTNSFLTQLATAYSMGFKNLTMQAAGGKDYEAQGVLHFQGYYSWAKYGYILEEDEEAKFKEWLSIHKLPMQSMWDLTINPKSLQTWKEEGFSWNGKFDLSKRSQSFKYLKRYLLMKGINAKSCNLPL